MNFTLSDIVLGQNISQNINMIISIVVYLIYKEWLLLSMEERGRTANVCWMFYKRELQWYSNVYKQTLLNKYTEYIDKLIDEIKV